MSAADEVLALLARIEHALPEADLEGDLDGVEDLTRRALARAELVTQLASMDLASLPVDVRRDVRDGITRVLARDAAVLSAAEARTREIAARSEEAVHARAAVRGYRAATRRDQRPGQDRRA